VIHSGLHAYPIVVRTANRRLMIPEVAGSNPRLP
jgi:hypothetical protein